MILVRHSEIIFNKIFACQSIEPVYQIAIVVLLLWFKSLIETNLLRFDFMH